MSTSFLMSPFFWGGIAALMSAATWALGSSLYTQYSRVFSPFAVNFTRGMIALPFFLVLSAVQVDPWRVSSAAYEAVGVSNVAWLALSIVASYGLGDAVFLWSTRYLGVPGALAIGSGYPIWTALFAAVFEGHYLSWLQALGLVASVIGMVIVILHAPGDSSDKKIRIDQIPWKGVGLAVLASVFWALNSYCVSRGHRGVSVAVANVIRMGFAMGMAYTFGRIFARQKPSVIPFRELLRGPFWGASFLVFVLEAFVGSYSYVVAFRDAPLVVAATLSSLAPVLAVPVTWALGLEQFSLARTAGVVLVVFGLSVLCS